MGYPATADPRYGSVPDLPVRTAILEAGVACMARHGYHGTSVRDIAAEAGISAANLYNHFGSKHDVLLTITDRALDLLLHATEEAFFAAGRDPAQRLSAIVGAHVRIHLSHPREALVCHSERRSLNTEARRLEKAKREIQQNTFDRVIVDGVGRGVFTTAYPAEAARWIVTACSAVATWFDSAGPLSGAEMVHRHQQLALNAVGYGRRCGGIFEGR
jgi:AcrR family transcriptional regulator